VDIPLSSLFETPTIAELAKLIENAKASATNDSSPIISQRRSAYKMRASWNNAAAPHYFHQIPLFNGWYI